MIKFYGSLGDSLKTSVRKLKINYWHLKNSLSIVLIHFALHPFKIFSFCPFFTFIIVLCPFSYFTVFIFKVWDLKKVYWTAILFKMPHIFLPQMDHMWLYTGLASFQRIFGLSWVSGPGATPNFFLNLLTLNKGMFPSVCLYFIKCKAVSLKTMWKNIIKNILIMLRLVNLREV